MNINQNPWGAHAPPKKTFLLQLIKKIGFSRGCARRAIAKRWKSTGIPFVDTVHAGIRFRLDFRRNTTDEKILTSSKIYDEAELDALSSVANDSESTFVDIGANTGYYSLCLWKRGFKKIIAIEPNPTTLQNLIFNVDTNHAQDIIEVAPYCAGAVGEIPFYASGGLGSASAIGGTQESPSCYVKAMPLIEILRKHNVNKIDALKIDVEGFEAKVLLPFFDQAPRTLFPRIVVIEDCHSDGWDVNVIDVLKKMGYHVAQKTRGNLILRLDLAECG